MGNYGLGLGLELIEFLPNNMFEYDLLVHDCFVKFKTLIFVCR